MVKPTALYYRILKYQPANYARLHNEFELIELETPDDDRPEYLNEISVLFAPLGYMVDRQKINACPKLKVIASNTTGHPHIDVEYARSRGIYVACLKYASDFLKRITPTAELTWGLIIALTRGICPAYQSVLEGSWDRRPHGTPAMLSRMSLGIVGHGRLGSMVARYGRAFNMRVRYFDPYVSRSDSGAERCPTLEELVAISDITTIHVPHEPETENMFDHRMFNRFKPKSYLVNTARGELIDWKALLNALETGLLAGAALDVFQGEFEPDFQQHFHKNPVLKYAQEHDNLILTPHIGGSTLDAWTLTEAHAIDMAMNFLNNSNRIAH
jgi:phosphoglycerate dehydrogenase-like enzyme